MKRIFLIVAAAIASVGLILYSGKSYIESIPEVAVLRLTASSAENTITASGNIQSPESECISASSDIFITELLVDSGDTIEEGTAVCRGVVISDSLLENYDTSDVLSVFSSGILSLSDDDIQTLIADQEVTTIYADKSGSISSVSVSENTLLSSGDTILTLSDQQYDTIVLNISETQIYEIEVGQAVNVSVTALPEQSFSGHVTDISDEAKQTTTTSGKETTVEVTVTLDEVCDVKSGFSAKCYIITSVSEDEIIIPYTCIDSDSDGDFVYMLSSDSTAVKKYITTKEEYSTGVSIYEDDIQEGDILIQDIINVSDGQKVSVGEVS